MKSTRNNNRYEVTTYDGSEINTGTISREQLANLQEQKYDHFFSMSLGIWAYRTIEGDWIVHEGADWPGIGDACIKIMQAMQFNPGEFQSPDDIVYLTGYSTFRSKNALSARLKAIREAHSESSKNRNFFLSRRDGGFAIAWNAKKTWCWVERLQLDSPEKQGN